MPVRSKRFCSWAGCRALVDTGRCPQHQVAHAEREAKRQAAIDAKRPSSTARGYDSAWRAVERQYLRAHPTCVGYGDREGRCGAQATEVDHVVPVAQAPELRLKWGNLRPYCKRCHSARTASEQAFGRASARPT